MAEFPIVPGGIAFADRYSQFCEALSGDVVAITVRDNGTGIPPTLLSPAIP